jgi:hypothetical protein
MNAMNGPIGVIVALAILIAGFLIFRAIVLWYWRVGEAIDLLRSIDEKLGHLASNLPAQTADPSNAIIPRRV